ncbi:hypothetical protein SB2_25515 [Methylobacterium radiotolerans]|nr:hypothetical protein SB3_28240 [Methylobacterium radiotolerans]KTS44097.1 hypothetical protein SB2_25515 [Methylobacterium radiotolerans]
MGHSSEAYFVQQERERAVREASADLLTELHQVRRELVEAANIISGLGLPSAGSLFTAAAERVSATLSKAEGR